MQIFFVGWKRVLVMLLFRAATRLNNSFIQMLSKYCWSHKDQKRILGVFRVTQKQVRPYMYVSMVLISEHQLVISAHNELMLGMH